MCRHFFFKTFKAFHIIGPRNVEKVVLMRQLGQLLLIGDAEHPAYQLADIPADLFFINPGRIIIPRQIVFQKITPTVRYFVKQKRRKFLKCRDFHPARVTCPFPVVSPPPNSGSRHPGDMAKYSPGPPDRSSEYLAAIFVQSRRILNLVHRFDETALVLAIHCSSLSYLKEICGWALTSLSNESVSPSILKTSPNMRWSDI